MTKKDRYRRMLIVVGLVAALACGCVNREPVDDPVNSGGSLVSEKGQIAFTHATKFNWTNWASSEADIYLINVDGSGERRLTDSPRLDGFPAWSSDGERLAFSSARDGGQSDIYVMNADGSEQRWLGDVSLIRRLTGTAAQEEEPTWSPDGQKIAFASEDDGDIYAMKVDGSGRTRLTDTQGYDHWPPTWSPDGTRIAFTIENTKGSEIYVMNSDGSGLTRLTDDPAEDFYPAWRP